MTTSNNNLPVRTYQPEFRSILSAVFEKRAYFTDFFGGGVEVLDGVANNETAFSVKTSDIPVVVGTYDKGANVAMGTGTGKSTRFGERKEIIYTTTDAPYTWDWAIHEGIDRHTVNNDLEATIADRLELQAQAKVNQMNAKHGTFISTNAVDALDAMADYSDANVLATFNELSKYFTNLETVGDKIAKVTPELYNAIVDHPLTTTGKNSTANVDANEIIKFKGFEIEELPEKLFGENEVAYAYVRGVGKAFIGINTTRTIESEDFDGVALQGSGRAGEFILDDNKPAVVKVNVTPSV